MARICIIFLVNIRPFVSKMATVSKTKIQTGMGRWLWDVGNVRNELIRGETGWSTFEE